jgi:DNA topoisomerase-1
MVNKSKTLVIVESPAKAKTITKYLGQEYIVRASFGHIIDLASGGKYGIGIDLEKDFKPKYKIIPDKKDKLQAIIDAASNVKEILIASDPDREGEAIAWHLAQALETTGVPIKRVLFHEITKNSILKSIGNPGDLNKDLFDAQQARRALDRIVGYLVSPFLINSLGPSLSAGRVQSVAVRMVVDREREIESFKPEEYWNILASLSKPESPQDGFVARYANKITNKETAQQVKTDLEGDTFVISELEEKEKKRNPLPPLITVSLQTTAAGRYKFPAARTMKAAQSLYESGLITYMRTDSVRSDPAAIDACRDWLKKHNHEFPSKPNAYASKGSAQDAHEAIRPTDVCKLPQNIYVSEDEQKIYRLIWERFVASQMNPALYDTVSLTVKSSSGHLLKANGRVLKYKGWLEITGDFENDDEGETKLPLLKKGDILTLIPPRVKAEQKFTQPPPRYSEKTLIKELEKRGIGRPSTYAAIMSKITDRNYVTKKGEMFLATEMGKKIIDALTNHFNFVEYKYTADMEEQLDRIAEGKLKYLSMMQEFYTPFSSQLKQAYTAHQKDYGFQCELCQEKMALKHGKFGFYMACGNYPACKNTFSCEMVDGQPVKTEKIKTVVEGATCPKCSAGMIRKDGKFGPFYSCSNYPKCNGSGKIPFGKKCSQCHTNELYMTVFNGQMKLACMGYPNCKNVEDLPSDAKVNWVDPQEIKDKPLIKTVQKVIETVKTKKVAKRATKAP